MDSGRLLKLVNEASQILDEKIEANEMKPEKHVVIRTKIENLKIEESSSSARSSNVYEERTTWSLAISDLLQKEIKKLRIFNDVVLSLVKEYGTLFPPDVNKKSQTEFWLTNFMFKILREKLEGGLTQERIIELISLLGSEMSHAPVRNRVRANLNGVYIESDSVELDEGVLIRKPKPSDLEYETYIIPHFIPSLVDPFHGLPTSILEINIYAKNDDEVQEKIERTLTLLRLYRLGSVSSPIYSLTKDSVIGIGGTQQRGSGRTTVLYRYTVQDSEAQALGNFFRLFEPLLPKQLLFGKRATALSVALNHYKNCLLEASQIDIKLMTALMGLESLYAFRGEFTEIGYRLSLRLARLLALLRFDPRVIKQNVKKSYRIRSKVAHGLTLKDEEHKKVGDLLRNILDYLRISILVFMSTTSLNKTELISLIEDSILDTRSLTKLENIIADSLKKIPEQVCKKK